MSKADYQLLNNYIDVISGIGDYDQEVRPHWADGTSAHTVKKFGVVNRYNLAEEFPLSGVRKLNWKAAIDEIIWIWLKKSNNVKDLNSKIWDQWANKGEHKNQEIGSIGKAYGYQLGQKTIRQKDGSSIDQVDNVLHELKFNPASRRILTNIYNHSDLHDMNLHPCAYEIICNVSKGTLNMILTQRSNDTLAAGSWNVVQYAALQMMLAQASGLKVGEMLHIVADSHVYDKHIPMELELIFHRCSLIQKRLLNAKKLEICSRVDSMDDVKAVEAILEMLQKSDVDFETEENLAKDVYLYDQVKDYEEYLNGVKQKPAFTMSKRLIKTMLEYPSIDKALGFSQPKLVLNPKIKDFYAFESPKKRTGSDIWAVDGKVLKRDGEIIDNPKSSFTVENYNPEEDGKELSVRVPVAE